MKYTTITVSIGGSNRPTNKPISNAERREIARQKRYTARAIRRAARIAISEALEAAA